MINGTTRINALIVPSSLFAGTQHLTVPCGDVKPIRKRPCRAGRSFDRSRYDTEKNEKHHGDRVWALALAVHAAGITRKRKRKRKVVTASIV